MEPLEYAAFVDLMHRADPIPNDSGGIQREAPALGIPVLDLRESTERQEAVEAGIAFWVGTDPDLIAYEASRLLDCEPARRAMTCVHSPLGRGPACSLIADATASFFKRTGARQRVVFAPLAVPFAQRTACGGAL
jgi:UDP-N-acetylglucosamine 2-epimerase (non-hydrolysing)